MISISIFHHESSAGNIAIYDNIATALGFTKPHILLSDNP